MRPWVAERAGGRGLLRALPLTHEELIAVEEAPDEELAALADKNLEERNRAVATGTVDPAVVPRR